eukprot:539944_1
MLGCNVSCKLIADYSHNYITDIHIKPLIDSQKMNIYNLPLLFISILHTCNSTISVTVPDLPTLAVDISPHMKLRDIQQHQQLTSYDGIRFSGQEYLFNDNQQLLSDIGIG